MQVLCVPHTSRVRPKRVSDCSGIDVEQCHSAVRRRCSKQKLAGVELQASDCSHVRAELMHEPPRCQVPHLQTCLLQRRCSAFNAFREAASVLRTRTHPSADADARSLPSGAKRTWLTPLRWPLYACKQAPSRKSCSLRQLSDEPEAANSLKGWMSSARQAHELPLPTVRTATRRTHCRSALTSKPGGAKQDMQSARGAAGTRTAARA